MRPARICLRYLAYSYNRNVGPYSKYSLWPLQYRHHVGPFRAQPLTSFPARAISPFRALNDLMYPNLGTNRRSNCASWKVAGILPHRAQRRAAEVLSGECYLGLGASGSWVQRLPRFPVKHERTWILHADLNRTFVGPIVSPLHRILCLILIMAPVTRILIVAHINGYDKE